MQDAVTDAAMRMQAFQTVERLSQQHETLSSEQLRSGFIFGGERVPLINPQRGIFKPQKMWRLLSIRTVFPKSGSRIWYDDQRDVLKHLDAAEETLDYAFMGKDPNAADNRWLREAMEDHIPIIYFVGVSPARCIARIGAFIVGWDPVNFRAHVAFSASSMASQSSLPEAPERRYSMRQTKQRVHQARFREMVMDAYGGRCAFSDIREKELLDAAHIIGDTNEDLGQPVIGNGLLLTKTHHAAFDCKLIGVDTDYRIHVAPRIMRVKDGPTLEALKKLDGQGLLLPTRKADQPDRERLKMSFDEFRAAM